MSFFFRYKSIVKIEYTQNWKKLGTENHNFDLNTGTNQEVTMCHLETFNNRFETFKKIIPKAEMQKYSKIFKNLRIYNNYAHIKKDIDNWTYPRKSGWYIKYVLSKYRNWQISNAIPYSSIVKLLSFKTIPSEIRMLNNVFSSKN